MCSTKYKRKRTGTTSCEVLQSLWAAPPLTEFRLCEYYMIEIMFLISDGCVVTFADAKVMRDEAR